MNTSEYKGGIDNKTNRHELCERCSYAESDKSIAPFSLDGVNFANLPTEIETFIFEGSDHDINSLVSHGFYNEIIEQLCEDNQLVIIPLITKVLHKIGIKAFNEDEITKLQQVQMLDIIDLNPTIAYNYIYELINNQIISASALVDEKIMEKLINIFESVHPDTCISIIRLFYKHISISSFNSLKAYEEMLNGSIHILTEIAKKPDFIISSLEILSESLKICNLEIILPLIRGYIPQFVDMFLSDSLIRIKCTAIMNFLIDCSSHDQNIAMLILIQRKEIICKMDDNEYWESAIRYIMSLKNYYQNYDDYDEACFFCLKQICDNLGELKMYHHLIFLDYIEWLILNFNEDSLISFLMNEISIGDLIEYIITLDEISENAAITLKVVKIVIFVLPYLIENSFDIPFSKIDEIIETNNDTENIELQERILTLSCIMSSFDYSD